MELIVSDSAFNSPQVIDLLNLLSGLKDTVSMEILRFIQEHPKKHLIF